jgi:predicted Zn-dependent protease
MEKYQRVIFIVHEEGVAEDHLEAIKEGISEVLRLTGSTEDFYIHNRHAWTLTYNGPDGRLVEFTSIEQFIEKSWDQKRNQINGEMLLKSWNNLGASLFWLLFWILFAGRRHYEIIVVKKDMYIPGTNFLIGLSIPGDGALVSTNRFLSLKDKSLQYECIKTMMMHEMGHVFGLPLRDYNVEEKIGRHCTNICVMRQGLYVPDDWIKMTEDRLKYGAFCKDCQQDLKKIIAQMRMNK